jgi:glycerophosphoryl diester phosphodiesterase
LAGLAHAQDAREALFDRLRAAGADGPVVVAHRGASADFPENTLAALRAAVAAKATIFEFDVHQTMDGAWVVLHDETCDRTTDAVAKFGRDNVRIDQLSLADARTLDAGAWRDDQFAGERIPTLEEALAAVFPKVPMIERKGGDARAHAAELRRLEVIDRVLVQAFDWPWLTQLHEAEPGLLLGALGEQALDGERLAQALATGARIVHWHHLGVDVENAAMVRAGGSLLCVYTIDDDIGLLGAAAIGCDLITTNRPARLADLVERGLCPRRIAPR